MNRSRRRAQRSQALVEFALVSPVLLLLTFGIIDFGRAMYFFVTLNSAAREVGHAAVRSSGEVTASGSTAYVPLPSDSDLTSVLSSHTPGMTVIAAPCPHGPIPSAPPPSNVGYLYITQPSPGAVAQHPPPAPDAPGGQASAAGGTCTDTVPASGQVTLQITLIYSYTPVTPLVSSAIGGHITLESVAIMRTEY